MMGKVIAIGAMGLTQILAWSVLLFAGSIAVGFVMFFFIDPATLPTTVDPNTVPDIASSTAVPNTASRIASRGKCWTKCVASAPMLRHIYLPRSI
jgi:hypothetical protein